MEKTSTNPSTPFFRCSFPTLVGLNSSVSWQKNRLDWWFLLVALWSDYCRWMVVQKSRGSSSWGIVFVYLPWIFRRICVTNHEVWGGFGSAVSSFLGVVVVRTLYDSNFFLVAISTYFLFIFYPKKLGLRIPCLQIVKKPQLYGSRNTPLTNEGCGCFFYWDLHG